MVSPLPPMTAADVTDLFRHVALRVSEARQMLGALDGAIGDADHGNSMAEGMLAVARACAMAEGRGARAGDLFAIAAQAFLDEVGATTGPLYASAFLQAGQRFAGAEVLDPRQVPDIVIDFAGAIAKRGKVSTGDKTMLDVWHPAARAVMAARAQGCTLPGTLDAAVAAASEGREATRAMVAATGRAARLGERTLGHVDPGAASAAIIIAALREGTLSFLDRKRPQ